MFRYVAVCLLFYSMPSRQAIARDWRDAMYPDYIPVEWWMFVFPIGIMALAFYLSNRNRRGLYDEYVEPVAFIVAIVCMLFVVLSDWEFF